MLAAREANSRRSRIRRAQRGQLGKGAARTLRDLSFNNFALTFNNFALTFKLCVRVAISWYQGCKKL